MPLDTDSDTDSPPDSPSPPKHDDLVGLTEIANIAGVSKQAAYNWTKRYDTFPDPYTVLSCGTIWLRSQVQAWIEDNTE